MSEGPYLFDVGVTALAHAGTPVSDTPQSYVREAIQGSIDAVVPYASLVGAHHVLSSVYGFSNDEAAGLMQRFMDAKRIHWYADLPERIVRNGFDRSGNLNIDGWDGYYAQVALEEGVETILTLDDDFERVDDVATEVVLSSEEFATLNEYLGY
ncbi:type II toxin-antitoxin system VapC family toxin [Halostella salina]|uniref:type II toxin-antitoxin system VapC family toxin n=1 Tax=Halostella salina TaxID=1547897 RepID=UPI001969AD0A|nr:type II toxin-antitoxin system VapC family toxin [Halostella salina]